MLSVWKPYRIFVMLEPIHEYFTEFILSFECLTPLWSLSAKGARSSALVYSISETAKLNNLRPYYYFRHILTELPKYCDEKGNIDPAKLDQLMPWADELPEECRKPRRS